LRRSLIGANSVDTAVTLLKNLWDVTPPAKTQAHRQPIGKWTARSVLFARLANGVVFPDKADKSVHV
jgi:hypothetical protein